MDKINKPEPKKIKLPALVDRSSVYDTLSFDSDTLYIGNRKSIEITDEDNRKDNSQSISELEAM